MAGSTFSNTSPAKGGAAVTPHDTNTLTGGTCRALYVGGGGDVAVVTADGSSLTFSAVPAGSMLLVQCAIVKSTGTTATLILALR